MYIVCEKDYNQMLAFGSLRSDNIVIESEIVNLPTSSTGYELDQKIQMLAKKGLLNPRVFYVYIDPELWGDFKTLLRLSYDNLSTVDKDITKEMDPRNESGVPTYVKYLLEAFKYNANIELYYTKLFKEIGKEINLTDTVLETINPIYRYTRMWQKNTLVSKVFKQYNTIIYVPYTTQIIKYFHFPSNASVDALIDAKFDLLSGNT